MISGTVSSKRTAVLAAITILLLLRLCWKQDLAQGLADLDTGKLGLSVGSSVANAISASPVENGLLANATLGFGAIFATLTEGEDDPKPWRRKGLIAAANRTGLLIEIPPPPPPISDEELEILMTIGDGPHPGHESARGYYLHQWQLKKFLESDVETMLLIDDDTDWELDIRKLLAPRGALATGIRASTNATHDLEWHPYGKEWDLLWLGHCGFESLEPEQRIVIPNQDTLRGSEMKAFMGKDYYRNLNGGTREIHPKIASACTFAVGISRRWAKKVLEDAHLGGTTGTAFTTNMHCKSGDFRCVGVLPELMHRQQAAGGHSKTSSLIDQHAHHGSKADSSAPPQASELASDEKPHFFTMNLKYSARCNANHDDKSRVTCPPTARDWKQFST